MIGRSYYEDILTLASGQDENGIPNAASGILMAFPDKEDTLELFLYAPVDIFASENASVCIFDFDCSREEDFKKAAYACLNYLMRDDDTMMVLRVIPLLLEGGCEILFTGLYHVDLYEGCNLKKRLVLYFENHELGAEEEMDIEGYRDEIRDRYAQKIKELDHMGKDLEDKLDQLAAGDSLTYEAYIDDLEEEEEDEGETWVRFVPVED